VGVLYITSCRSREFLDKGEYIYTSPPAGREFPDQREYILYITSGLSREFVDKREYIFTSPPAGAGSFQIRGSSYITSSRSTEFTDKRE
jgi:hypothetical protein